MKKPIDVLCPRCGAVPGRYCPFPIPGGYAGTYDYTHIERRDLARRTP